MNMDLNAYESLKQIALNRHSVREYADREVPEEIVEKIIEIAKSAPYVSGRGNWGIEAIRDRDTIRHSADIVDEKAERIAQEIEGQYGGQFRDYARSFSFYRNAPLLLVPYFREASTLAALIDKPDKTILTWERDNYIKSISCVTMLVLLAAESLGMAACCVTGALIAEDELCHIFKIKNGRRIGAVIPIGYKK
jgi:nitroreductase